MHNSLSTVLLDKSSVVRVDFPFGSLDLYRDHLISTINGGVNLDHAEVAAMCTAIQEHYGTRSYGFLAHRKNGFSVNPMASRRIVTETSVVAGAFVSDNGRVRAVFESELLFYQRPCAVCATIEEAEIFLARHLFPRE